jgi:hypothetical protein
MLSPVHATRPLHSIFKLRDSPEAGLQAGVRGREAAAAAYPQVALSAPNVAWYIVCMGNGKGKGEEHFIGAFLALQAHHISRLARGGFCVSWEGEPECDHKKVPAITG